MVHCYDGLVGIGARDDTQLCEHRHCVIDPYCHFIAWSMRYRMGEGGWSCKAKWACARGRRESRILTTVYTTNSTLEA